MFDNNKLMYNYEQLNECVMLSQDVYKDKSLGNSIEDYRFHSKCSIYDKNTYLTITFRGTASINNWANNLYTGSLISYKLSNYFKDIDFLDRHDLEGHHGFFKMAHRLLQKIENSGLISKTKPLRIYGHSLGGALATITAYCLSYKGYMIEHLITIGCPRVFKVGTIVTPEASFKEIVPNAYRLMNEDDIVTFLPLHSQSKKFINFDFESVEETENPIDLWKMAVAGASFNIGISWAWDKIIDQIFYSVKHFRHVGTGIILSGTNFNEIGLEDERRNVDDIKIDVYYKYLSLLFSNEMINAVASTLGVNVAYKNFATLIEELVQNQWILNKIRVFTFNWNEIGYEMTENLFQTDPFYQKIIRLTGDDPKIKGFLPLLDFERGKRRFFGVILPQYYKQVNGYIYTQLKKYKTFKDSSEKVRLLVVDEIMENWINDDTLIIGKSKTNAINFYKIVRDALLRKFVGNSKTQTGGLRKRLGFVGQDFVEQNMKTLIFASVIALVYFLLYSVIMYRMTYKGSYDHQIEIYKHNIDKHFGRGRGREGEEKSQIGQQPRNRPQPLAFLYYKASDLNSVILI